MQTHANLRRAMVACVLALPVSVSAQQLSTQQTPAPQLASCPESPNCVSSAAAPDDPHYIAPLRGKGNVTASMAALEEILSELPRVTWERRADNHLHAVFTSLVFRFDDDVDLIVQPDGNIEVRSASRTGYSDLGANRRRVERLRARLSQTRF